jgi:photosystem II stability/assembly factor-like uncharacterized protein
MVLAWAAVPIITAHAGTWVAHNAGLRNMTVIGIGISPSNPDTLYIQGRSLGIYKSTNGGATWTRRSSGIPDADPGLGHLLHHGPLVHPSNPDTAWAVSNGYVYKTTNGGITWSQSSTGTTLNGVSAVRGVVIDPSNPDHLFAGTIGSGIEGGVFESNNGGASWTNIAGSLVPGSGIGNDAWPLAINPVDAQRLHSGSPHNSTYYSTDGGHTWINSPPVPGDLSSYEVAVNPASPQQIWASAVGFTWVSNNYGLSWSKRTDLPGAITAIAFAPSYPQVAYAIIGSTIWRSLNNGATWEPQVDVPGGPRCLAIHPAVPETVYVGTWGLGMFKSTDGAASFAEINSGLPLTTLIHGQQAFAAAGVTYCMLSGNTLYRLDAGTNTWQYYSVAPGNYIQVDSHNASRWYCAGGGLWRSLDAGLTWEQCYAGSGAEVFGFWLDPITCDRLLLGDRQGYKVFESLNAGDTWTQKGALNPTPSGWMGFNDVCGDPYDPNIVLAASGPTYGSNRQYGYIWRSTDGGATWSHVRDRMFYQDWRIGDGEWYIINGAMHQRVRTICNYRVNLDQHTFGDGSYECRVRILGSNNDDMAKWAGFVIRMNDRDSHYGLSGWLVFMRRNGAVCLYNVTDGVMINPDQAPVVADTSQWTTLRLVANGNAFELFVNGSSIGTYLDPHHRFDGPGYFGLATCQTESEFDDVNLQAGTTFTDSFTHSARYGASLARWLACDPHNPGVFALSSQGGGIWRSTDHGASWSRITPDSGEGLVNYRPIISSRLDGNIYACRGLGYAWTIDNLHSAGTAMQKLGQTLQYSSINVSEDPDDPQRLLAAVYAQGILIYSGADVAGTPAPPFPTPGDFDGDGDIDQEDYGHLQACMSGPGVLQARPECADTLLDLDDDTDIIDVQRFLQCRTAPGVEPPPACRCRAP